MKRKFNADPLNILGAVLVLLLAFTVIVTVFLLVGYNRFVPAPREDVTTAADGSSFAEPTDAVTTSPITSGESTKKPDDQLSDTSRETENVSSAPDTSLQPTPTSPEETTKSPDTTAPADKEKKTVAFTFDDGPHATYTLELLKVLEKYNVKATFFVLGTNLKKQSRIDALKMTVAAGHEIGNHSYSHPTVLNISADEFIADVEKGSNAIYEACGVRPSIIRTPGGKFSTELLEKIKYPIIHWTVDTRDWEHNDPEKCLETLKKQVVDGAVILMHDRKSNTARSVELMIEWLLENDYQITTVSELMELKGTELVAGKVYYSSSIFKPKN